VNQQMATTYPINLNSVVEIKLAARATGAAGDSKPVVNLLHYFQPAIPVALPNLLALVNNFASFMAAPWASCFAAGYVMSSVSCRWVNDPTTGAVFFAAPGTFSGGVVGDYQPADSSTFIEKVMAWRLRGARPGLHLSPVPESFTTDFTINGVGALVYGTLIAGLSAVITDGANNWTPCVWSPKSSTTLAGIITPMGCPLTSFRLRQTLGTMLRRKVRGRY
jgi:hypothetical protein